ncbi:hypothetical protein CN971_23790 [Bacillus thuringiensis]|uniref:Uncharacterized protein n=2 Tax=Bacillus TaxID=1386 RepID=A0A9X7BMK8_BACTU|nr:hypothetical protein COM82_30590 [Bacillus thuringiensis]PED27104.1 hypothetical protein CON34_06930 [Bacillus thuringiensis]PFV29629.1 hypothetical protein COK99_17230 [Bacillus thuringiensis]PGN17780.1 hypothetical protein CN969_27110 [Bacillus thuringiensis]PGN28068.1 hypothetical protein CN971_23790 [Bacillus thuringiensis]
MKIEQYSEIFILKWELNTMQNDRALFSIWHTIPGRLDFPIDRYHMTFSDVWSYVNFLEKYGMSFGNKEIYFLYSVDFKFHSVPADERDSDPIYNEQIFLTLKRKEDD